MILWSPDIIISSSNNNNNNFISSIQYVQKSQSEKRKNGPLKIACSSSELQTKAFWTIKEVAWEVQVFCTNELVGKMSHPIRKLYTIGSKQL